MKTTSEILDAIIEQCLSQVEVLVDHIARRPVSATERLEAVVLELHRNRCRKLVEDHRPGPSAVLPVTTLLTPNPRSPRDPWAAQTKFVLLAI
ncbi:MAG: hypothetical protein ACYDH9_22610 [Limisphaerales bacterium]